jgi:hypothetical protein
MIDTFFEKHAKQDHNFAVRLQPSSLSSRAVGTCASAWIEDINATTITEKKEHRIATTITEEKEHRIATALETVARKV